MVIISYGMKLLIIFWSLLQSYVIMSLSKRAQTKGVSGQFNADMPLPMIKGEIWSGTLVVTNVQSRLSPHTLLKSVFFIRDLNSQWECGALEPPMVLPSSGKQP